MSFLIMFTYRHNRSFRSPGRHRLVGGFTLVETIVALSVFIVFALVAMSALISQSETYRKVEGMRAAIDNLNYALEHVSRTARFGGAYECWPEGVCPPGGSSGLRLRSMFGNTVIYELGGENNTQITRSINGEEPIAITSPEVEITSLTFRVLGDGQPRIMIMIAGFAGDARGPGTSFNLQTMVTQRQFSL
jgi:type II secretory pathway pseudopilin PulG